MGRIRDSVDVRALRFAVGFPLMLAAAFVVCALLIRADLPEPLAVRWTGDGAVDFAPFGAVVGVGAAMIVLVGWAVLLQAAPLSRPALMRRFMMGAGLAVSLFVTTVLAAVLVGQLGLANARESRVDVVVLAMGSGAALGLGIATLFPAALLTVAVPWLAALLVAVALLAAVFLFARIRVDRSGLRVFAAGFLRV